MNGKEKIENIKLSQKEKDFLEKGEIPIFSMSNSFSKVVEESNAEAEMLDKYDLVGLELILDESINFNITGLSNLEMNFTYTDKNFIKMNQVKAKRLKKKYMKRTILYRMLNA